jgi:hypothetical protein
MYPGGACLVEAASLMWNKVLVPIHFAVSCSEDGDGLLRWRSSGSAVPDFGDFCVGAFGRMSAVMVFTALRGEARGEAAMSAVVWYVDLAPSSPGLRWVGRWVAQIRARVCMGCVPGRCLLGFFFPFVAGCYCGSSQSHWAMMLSWVCGWRPFLSVFSGDVVDGGGWSMAATPVDMKALKDFLVIFFSAEGLRVVWKGQFPSLYPLRMCSYVYASLYGLLTW